MKLFDQAMPAPSRQATATAHDAIQLLAAAGVTLLTPDAQFHYSSTEFDPVRGAFLGAELPDKRRLSLRVRDLVLTLGSDTLDLRGKSGEEALRWLSEVLGAQARLPEWEMPNGPLSDVPAFEASDQDLARLGQWYEAAHEALSAFEPGAGTASTLRVWPHHFDLATLVTLQASDDPEHARTIGIGMTPGDAGIPQPYLYLTPWPYPQVRDTPALPAGRWNVEGWYGAVLEADQVTSATQVQAFLRAAFDHAAAGLDR